MALSKLIVPLTPLILWRNFERPLNWEEIFGRQAPLDLEIGFGRGEFFEEYSAQHPDRDLVAIENRWPSIQKGLRRLAQEERPNVRLIQEDIWTVLQRVFEPRSLSKIFALFPCPWPKKKHLKNRLFTTEFLALMNSRLRDDGEIMIVTDFRPLLEWVLEQVPGSGLEVEWEIKPPRFGTKYEDKWRSQGQQEFFELRFRKRDHQEIPNLSEVQVNIHRLPTLDLGSLRQIPLPSEFPADQASQAHVKLRELFHDSEQQRVLLRATIAEDNLTQGMWIEIKPKHGEWIIRPARGCSIVPTAGIQRALDLVRDAALKSNNS